MAHPLENIMQSTVSELKNLAGVDTVVGCPIQLGDGRMILPVSKVSLGFVSGGAEYGTKSPVMSAGLTLDNSNRAYPFAGTLTAGVSVMPVAFLSVTEDHVSVLPANEQDSYAKIVQMMPELIQSAGNLVKKLMKNGNAQ